MSINFFALREEIQPANTVHVGTTVVVFFLICDVIGKPGSVLYFPFTDALSLASWIERKGSVTIVDKMKG